MNSIYSTLIFWLSATSLIAQTYKYGDIPDNQINLSIYEQDSSASAVVLFDVGNAEINYKQHEFKLEVTRHTRIKILNDDALSLADVSIRYRSGKPKQRIVDLKAVSYCQNEKGKLIKSKLGRREKFNEKVDEYWTLYKFSIPNVRVGCILEYQYKLTSDYLFDFPNWFFQREIPTIWSELNTKIPNFFKFLNVTRGYHKYFITEETQYLEQVRLKASLGAYSDGQTGDRKLTQGPELTLEGNNNKYVMKDVPGIKNEPFMKARIDYLAYIKFELASIYYPNSMPKNYIPTWNDLVADLDEFRNYGDRLKSSASLRDAAISATLGVESNFDKMIAIYNHVQNNIKWDERHRLYLKKSLEDVYKEGSGHSTAINLVLVQMLKEIGFDAYPVIVSTAQNGEIIGLFPEESQFNSTITYVNIDGQYYLLDPKNPSRPYNILPFNLLGRDGLMINTKELVWLPIDQVVKNSSFKNITITIDPDSLKGEINTQLKGLYAVDMDKLYKSEDFSKELTKEYFGSDPIYEVSNLIIKNNNVLEGYDINFKINGEGVNDNTLYYFNPMIVDLIESNPFKLENRTYPIDYDYPFDESIVMTINIPEGWTIDELPQPVLYRLPGKSGQFRRVIQAQGNQIKMNFQLKINKIRFMPNEYKILKGMYDQMVTSLAEQIVLKKKS